MVKRMGRGDIEPYEDETGDYLIALPRRHFGEFITSLLGQPRSIKKLWRDNFVIDRDYIEHIAAVIAQRAAQNKAVLSSFSADIYLSDLRTHSVSTIDALMAFRDVSSKEVIGLDMIWVYFIQFPEADIPQRQEIKLSFKSKESEIEKTVEGKLKSLRNIAGLLVRSINGDSAISATVDYTYMTWGNDIINLIDREISARIEKENILVSTTRLLLTFLAPFIMLTPMIPFFLWEHLRLSQAWKIRGQLLEKIDKMDDIVQIINVKLDAYHAHQLQSIEVPIATFSIHLFTSISVLAIAISFIAFKPRSYILINCYTQSLFTSSRLVKSRVWFLVILSFIVSITSSLFANYIQTLIS